MSTPKDALRTELVRQKLKSLDTLELPMDPQFFENLHDNIMKKIEAKETEDVSMINKGRRFSPAHWREWFFVF